MWDADPVMAPFKIAAKLGLSPGYAGPPNRKSAEVLTKYVITDMYAKAVQGMSAEEAVKWAAEEVRKVYAGA
jgi:multiple sugar transport system substrate-binding protein